MLTASGKSREMSRSLCREHHPTSKFLEFDVKALSKLYPSVLKVQHSFIKALSKHWSALQSYVL